MKSKREEVRERRDREQIATAIRARKLTGNETLHLGLELSDMALRAVEERYNE